MTVADALTSILKSRPRASSKTKSTSFTGVVDASSHCAKEPTGSSKSTILDALSLTFGRTQLVRQLTEHDFFGLGCPVRRYACALSVIAKLEGVSVVAERPEVIDLVLVSAADDASRAATLYEARSSLTHL